MISLPQTILAIVTALFLAVAEPSLAQHPAHMPETRSAAPYHPGLGELMTAFVQPHHIKLGLAGGERNWPLAAYELGELSETFDDVAKQVPEHDNLPIPEMIASTVKPPMTALDTAIKAKNAAAFTKAFADLTASCNTCHQAANHPMIVIKVPNVSSFPDQDFRPSPK